MTDAKAKPEIDVQATPVEQAKPSDSESKSKKGSKQAIILITLIAVLVATAVINLNHSAVKTMEGFLQTDIDKARKYAEVLYCQALLIAGLPLENPSEYTDLVCSLI